MPVFTPEELKNIKTLATLGPAIQAYNARRNLAATQQAEAERREDARLAEVQAGWRATLAYLDAKQEHLLQVLGSSDDETDEGTDEAQLKRRISGASMRNDSGPIEIDFGDSLTEPEVRRIIALADLPKVRGDLPDEDEVATVNEEDASRERNLAEERKERREALAHTDSHGDGDSDDDWLKRQIAKGDSSSDDTSSELSEDGGFRPWTDD